MGLYNDLGRARFWGVQRWRLAVERFGVGGSLAKVDSRLL